jgi:hypothetical protein
MFFAISALVLSTLALLSQGWVLDDSCYDYPRETRDAIRDAMEESEAFGKLGQSYVTRPWNPTEDQYQFEDPFDNTRPKMFRNALAADLLRIKGMA